MSDEKLREALEVWDDWLKPPDAPYNAVVTVAAAARAHLDCGGEAVWWCETHANAGLGPIGDGPRPQGPMAFCWWAAYQLEMREGLHDETRDCRMVEAVLTVKGERNHGS